MNVVTTLIEEDEQDVADAGLGLIQMLGDGFQGDLGGVLHRVTVDTSADGRKAYGARAAFFGKVETGAVAAGKLAGFAVLPAAIDRTNGVENVMGRKGARTSHDGAAGGTSAGPFANLIELAHDGGAAGAVDRAIDAPTSAESGIGGVSDRIDADFGDIADQKAELLSVRKFDLHVLSWHGLIAEWHRAARQQDSEGARSRGSYSKELEPSRALVLFDIDGTLIRRAGEHHRQALVEAVRRTVGIETTTDGVPVSGMLDRDILTVMMTRAGMKPAAIRQAMPIVIEHAQSIYVRTSPVLERKVCPGVRRALWRLERRGAVIGLVTGNLTRIGWRKMERAGIRHYFRYGAFAELAKDRAGLVRIAIRHARREGWIGRETSISLIGDHPNDVRAARANDIRAVAVATGLIPMEELRTHAPDILLPDLRSLAMEMLF